MMRRYTILLVLLLLLPLTSGIAVAEDTGAGIHLASVGYLQVLSPVEGARVYFDRLYMGYIQDGNLTIPVDVNVLPQYKDLLLQYSGYQTYIGPLPTLVPGKTVAMSVNLNKTGYEMMGIVSFESTPPGVEILMNGESKGITPDSGHLMIQTVPSGLYEFTVRRPGNLTHTEQQYVSSNAITVYRVAMEPAVSGSLMVTSTPDGSGIYIDNRYVGLSPMNIPDLPIGGHTVKVTKEGYQEWSGQVTIVGSGSDLVDAVLVAIPPTVVPTTECATPVPTPTQKAPFLWVTPFLAVLGSFLFLAGVNRRD